MTRADLSVLDLVPVAAGSDPGQAVARSMELAAAAERAGYRRYWFAEHHLNPGVAGTSPAILLALAGAATSTIRIGAGAVQMGHRTPLATVEEFGLLDAVYPGRVDLGLGRSGGPRVPPGQPVEQDPRPITTPEGLLLPRPVSLAHLARSPRMRMQRALLQQPEAATPLYDDQVGDVLDLLAGTFRSDEGVEAHVVPGEGAQLQVWVLGSSAGESAIVAGRRGLRFAANYHVSPASVLEAVGAYREAFRPSADLDAPWVAVSADVVVAGGRAEAERLAAGYDLWVHSIRSGAGAVPWPTPEDALAGRALDAEARALVEDRMTTRFVGSPADVVDRLGILQAATGADELVVTTMVHDHAARLRSLDLLADAWDAAGRRRSA